MLDADALQKKSSEHSPHGLSSWHLGYAPTPYWNTQRPRFPWRLGQPDSMFGSTQDVLDYLPMNTQHGALARIGPGFTVARDRSCYLHRQTNMGRTP